MSDKIREAFDGWCDTDFSGDEYDLQMSESAFVHGYKAGAASRTAEISGLVEALESWKTYWEKSFADCRRSKRTKALLSRYTKTTCPGCGGQGYNNGLGQWMTIEKCPTCKGRGYVWEKK